MQNDDRFRPYVKVFAEFGFSEKVSALLLSTIFPIENFLRDGKPKVRIRKGRKSGNSTARHLSQRRLQKAIDVAPVREESGDKMRRRTDGSSMCRKAYGRGCSLELKEK